MTTKALKDYGFDVEKIKGTSYVSVSYKNIRVFSTILLSEVNLFDLFHELYHSCYKAGECHKTDMIASKILNLIS